MVFRNFEDTPEFLLLDLLNKVDQLAEDLNKTLLKVWFKAKTMDNKKLKKSLLDYWSPKTKKLLERILAA